ncbi:MAG: inositol monophosphatase family protein [Pseudomonadales bacterium]
MQPMANLALRAAREAGKQIARAFDRPDLIKVSQKGHNDYVTNVDKEAERIIVDSLLSHYPDHKFTGEEAVANQGRDDAEYEWLIDPLDGTLNFSRQIPHFCVALACLRKGVLEHAVILDPMRQEEFVASRGQGCQLNGRRTRVSSRKELDGAVITAGGPNMNEVADRQSEIYAHLFRQGSVVRQLGSACLDLAYVAAGRLDGVWLRGLKPWDIAAGALMVTESGGLISDFVGDSKYLQSGNVVAAPPKCFKILLPIVRKHLA